MRHGLCDLHLCVMQYWCVLMRPGKVFLVFSNSISCVQGHKPKLLPQDLCHVLLLLVASGEVWWYHSMNEATSFMCSLVLTCTGYSVLNGSRPYSAALFSQQLTPSAQVQGCSSCCPSSSCLSHPAVQSLAESPASRNDING